MMNCIPFKDLKMIIALKPKRAGNINGIEIVLCGSELCITETERDRWHNKSKFTWCIVYFKKTTQTFYLCSMSAI